MSDASVRLVATSSSQATTGFDGAFSFSGIRGTAALTVTASGYETQSTSATVSAATSLDIRLRRVVGRAIACGDAPALHLR